MSSLSKKEEADRILKCVRYSVMCDTSEEELERLQMAEEETKVADDSVELSESGDCEDDSNIWENLS